MNDHSKSTADDLRAVLLARLELLADSHAKAKARLLATTKSAEEAYRIEAQGLEEERDAISRLLTIEERKHGGPVEMPGINRAPVLPLGDFFERVARANGPKSKEEFKIAANQAGYDLDGRGVHAAVTNLLRTSRLEMRDDGRYGIPANRPVKRLLDDAEVPF